MKWKVYCADGDTFSNENGEPWLVPLTGIVCVAQWSLEAGRTITRGFNYYYFRDGEWWGCYDSAAMLIELTSDMTGDIDCVRAGRTVSNEKYNDIMTNALHDDGLPNKSSTLPREYPTHAIKRDGF